MKRNVLNASYLSAMCMELCITLRAGISVSETIGILASGEENSNIKKILDSVYENIRYGGMLSDALEQSKAFPRYMSDMIRVGEQTGKLETTFNALAEYYERQEKLSENIRNAILHPVALLIVLLVVVVVLTVKVMPIFDDAFNQLGGSMQGLAAGILQFGKLIKKYWFITLAFVVGVIVAVYFIEKKGERLLLSKKLAFKAAASKVASVISMALCSGMNIDMALDMAESLSEHTILQEKLRRCRLRISTGESASSVFADEQIFTGIYCHMLAVGERAGSLDVVMQEIAQRSSDAVNDEIDKKISAVEPLLVVIMALVVGLILMSVMLPLANIMMSIS